MHNNIILQLLVWVDPLDGTGEYVRGLDNPCKSPYNFALFCSNFSLSAALLQQVTVLIGITHQGRAIAGVVHQPYYKRKEGNEEKEGRTIWGIARVGTFGLEITKS
jgi:3'(2'), 5'-bisphosphate nucleotidase